MAGSREEIEYDSDLVDAFHFLASEVQGANQQDAQEALRARAACLERRRLLLARERKFVRDMLEELQTGSPEVCATGVESQEKEKKVWGCNSICDFMKDNIFQIDCLQLDAESFICAGASEECILLTQAQYSDLSGFDDPFALMDADSPIATMTLMCVLPDGRPLVAFAEKDSPHLKLRKATIEDGEITAARDLSATATISALASHSISVAGACGDHVSLWNMERHTQLSRLPHPDSVVVSVRHPDKDLVASLSMTMAASTCAAAPKSCVTFWDVRTERCHRQVPAPAANSGAVFFDIAAGGPGRYIATAISSDGSLEAWDTRHTLHRLCKTDVRAPHSDSSVTAMSLHSDGSIAIGYASRDGSNVGTVTIGQLPDLTFQTVDFRATAISHLYWAPRRKSAPGHSDCVIAAESSGQMTCLSTHNKTDC